MKKIILALIFFLALPLAANAACGAGAGTCFVVAAGGNSNSTSTWSASSGGATCTCVPAATDAVILDSAAGNLTANAALSIASIDASGTGGSGSPYTGTLTHNAGVTITIGGLLFKLVAGMTYTVSNNQTSILSFTSTSGTTAITTAGKTMGQTTLNGAGGTFQLQDNFTGQAQSTTTLTNGTFDLNGKTMTQGLFSSSNSNTRGLTCGTGTMVLNSAGGVLFDLGTSTNFTLSCASGTIEFAAVAGNNGRTINLGSTALTYGTVKFDALTTNGGADSFNTNSGTVIGQLTINGPRRIGFGTTFTATNMTITGVNGGIVQLSGSAGGTGAAVTITATNAPTATWVAFGNVTFATSAMNATNCFDMKGNNFNTGGCTAPSTGGGASVIGGWLLKRDLDPDNDNIPAWIDVAA